jgi:hypothetical protein
LTAFVDDDTADPSCSDDHYLTHFFGYLIWGVERNLLMEIHPE